MTGFTFPFKQKDVFVRTYKQYKTKKLAREILRKMLLPDSCVPELMYWLQKANCELRTLPNGKQFYHIYGDKFCIMSPVDEVIIVEV